jgi:serine/threonine-protein kinase RsbT
MMGALTLTITNRADAERARREARTLARTCGFSAANAERVALAVSELAWNVVRYARGGALQLGAVDGPRGRGIRIECTDQGPGIPDLERALEEGYSTGGGLGAGLPAVRRLMGEFSITTGPTGTRIVATRWPTCR